MASGLIVDRACGAPSAPASPTPALTPAYPDATDATALGRWFGQTTHLPAKSILAITDNAIFAAFPRHQSGAFSLVDVRVESITEPSTVRLGGRSIHLRLNVRCDNNTVRLNSLDVYPGADLTGPPAHRAPPNDWAQPKPNSYVADAVRLVCDKTFQTPFAAVATTAAQRPLSDTTTASNLEAAPKPAYAPAEASTRHAVVLRPTQPLPGGYAVQIGAYSTPASSQVAWGALRVAMPALTQGLTDATRSVKTGGHTFYRAIVRGFPSSVAAATFCQTLRTSGRPCLTLGLAGP